MGNQNANEKKHLKCHVKISQWNEKSFRKINQEQSNRETNYLLTLSGSLFIQENRFEWISKFENDEFLKTITIMNFNFNHLESKKLKSYISNQSINNSHFNNSIWELLNIKTKNLNQKGIALKENDIFRIGKQIIKIKMVIIQKEIESQKNLSQKENEIFSQNEHFNIIYNLPKTLNKKLTCRVCLSKETEKNRFHNFCNCKKSMPTHLSCLQTWLQKNVVINEGNGITFYNFLNICCDVCQSQFPSTYKNIQGNIVPLIKPKFPENSPFVLLEIYLIEDPSIIKALMIFDMTFEKSITVGTDEESDIIFKHSSISRDHCFFIIKKDGFYLLDRHSKFGSFQLLNKKIKLKKKKIIILKIENYLIEIHPFINNNCFCLKNNENKKIHFDINPYKLDIKYLLSNMRMVKSLMFLKNEDIIKTPNKKKLKISSIQNLQDIDNRLITHNRYLDNNDNIKNDSVYSSEEELESIKNPNVSFKSILSKNNFSKKSVESNYNNHFITSFNDSNLSSINFANSEKFEISLKFAFK